MPAHTTCVSSAYISYCTQRASSGQVGWTRRLKESNVRHDFVRVFRMVTCAGLVALLAARIGHIPVSKLVFFLALVLVWFIATLLLTRSQEVSRTILRHAGLVGAVDGYLVLVVAAVALRAVWHMPLLLLGAYVFLAALAGGVWVGAAAAGATFFGLLNGWLLPENALHARPVLQGVITAVIAMACGTAWWYSLPLLLQVLRQESAVEQESPASPGQPMAERIAVMETRLREMSAERDRLQERLSEAEARQAAGTTAQAPEPQVVPEPVHTALVLPATDDPALKAKLEQVAASLTDSRAAREALLAEKQKLLGEIADLTKELTAVKASIASEAANASAT